MDGQSNLTSVIIPTYNRSNCLQDAIESVFSQTYSNIELIVINDGSTDDTADHLEKYNSEITTITNDENKGVSYSRNRGIKCATGEYVAFLDDDDQWRSDKLERQVEIIEDLPADYCGIYTGARTIQYGKVIGETHQRITGDIYPEIMVRFFAFPFTSFLLRRDAVEKIGKFDTTMNRGEDWDLTIRLAREYNFEAIDEPLVDRTIHEENVSGDPRHGVESRRDIWEKHGEDIKRYPQVKRRFDYLLRRYEGLYELSRGNRLRAGKKFIKNLQKQPSVTNLGLLLFSLIGPTGLRVARRVKSRYDRSR